VELDGAATHNTRQAFERDRARDRKAVATGHRVVRITWRQLHEDARTLAAELRAPLEAKYPGMPQP
jgi:very-short-patch-repair endonuclease